MSLAILMLLHSYFSRLLRSNILIIKHILDIVYCVYGKIYTLSHNDGLINMIFIASYAGFPGLLAEPSLSLYDFIRGQSHAWGLAALPRRPFPAEAPSGTCRGAAS